MMPHAGHTELIIVVVTVGVDVKSLVKKTQRRRNAIVVAVYTLFIIALNLHLQASTPSSHL